MFCDHFCRQFLIEKSPLLSCLQTVCYFKIKLQQNLYTVHTITEMLMLRAVFWRPSSPAACLQDCHQHQTKSDMALFSQVLKAFGATYFIPSLGTVFQSCTTPHEKKSLLISILTFKATTWCCGPFLLFETSK